MMHFWRWFRKNDRIFTLILNLTMIFCLVISVGLFAMSKKDPDKILDTLHYQPVFIQTGSMEPVMRTNGIVIVKKVDSMDELKKDDIIMYRVYDESGKAITITHRIYNIKEDGTIITKGDNNRVGDAYELTIDNVRGEVVGIWNGFADLIALYVPKVTQQGIALAIGIITMIVVFGYGMHKAGQYLDEKYDMNDNEEATVNDQLKADNDYVLDEKDDCKEVKESQQIAQTVSDQQIPKLLDTERNSWQYIYNYNVDENNLLTITGMKQNYLSLTEISVPEKIKHKKVVAIGPFAFSNSNATIIHLPESIERIEKAAFYRCDKLLYVNLPDAIHTIEDNAFNGCSSLIDMKLPISLKRVSDKMLANCEKIDSITLHSNLLMIGDSAFYGCKNLATIYGGQNVKLIKLNAFSLPNTKEPILTHVITNNEALKEYCWEKDGRSLKLVDSEDLITLLNEDDQQSIDAYDALLVKQAEDKEKLLSTKISKSFDRGVEKLSKISKKIKKADETAVHDKMEDNISDLFSNDDCFYTDFEESKADKDDYLDKIAV